MKKVFILLCLMIGIVYIYTNNSIEENIIPKEAIRFRVVANSNSVYDQNIKIQIRNEVQNKLLELTRNENSLENTRKVLKDNINLIDNIVSEKIKELGYDKNYEVNYGLNYFPEKKYKGVKYEAGNYESLVITLGSGSGDNWWCVLFPPLCLIESEEEMSSNVEYKSYIKEIIQKYIK